MGRDERKRGPAEHSSGSSGSPSDRLTARVNTVDMKLCFGSVIPGPTIVRAHAADARQRGTRPMNTRAGAFLVPFLALDPPASS